MNGCFQPPAYSLRYETMMWRSASSRASWSVSAMMTSRVSGHSVMGAVRPTADLPRLLNGKKQFLSNRAAAGRTAAIAEWPLTRDVIIADTDREARELAERHIMVSYRKEYAGGWKHPFIDASIATDLDGLMKHRFLIGGPDQVRKSLEPFVTEYGLTHLICRLFFPGMPHRHIMRELELIAQEVMPAFQ